jgi:hypothetical protein
MTADALVCRVFQMHSIVQESRGGAGISEYCGMAVFS